MDNGFSKTSGNHMVRDEDPDEFCEICGAILTDGNTCEKCGYNGSVDEDCDISIRGER